MKALLVTREYPPHIYGGAGVVADQLSRALKKRMDVEVRCFGDRAPRDDGIIVRGYIPWDRVQGGKDGPRFAPALETLSIGLAMARDAVDADVAHAHEPDNVTRTALLRRLLDDAADAFSAGRHPRATADAPTAPAVRAHGRSSSRCRARCSARRTRR